MTKHFAVTCAMKGIGRCNCIVLGGLYNEKQNSEFRKKYIQKVPLGRMASITDVINSYEFLTSEKSSYITGISLNVDGGYTCI